MVYKYCILVLVISSSLVYCSASSDHVISKRSSMMISDYPIFNHDYKLNKFLEIFTPPYLLNTIWINSSNIGGIQAAVDSASPGDTILLDGGTYNEHDININKVNLTIAASGSGGVPVIDAEGQGRIFNITNDNITLNGLKMINGDITGSGGGVFFGESGSVVNCSFINTRTSSSIGGGGIYMSSGSSVIGCNFTNTITNGYGGGVYLGGNGSVVNCSFTNIRSSAYGGILGGGVYLGGNGSVSGCIFNNTTTNGYGGGLFLSSGGSVVNCSFTNTRSNDDGGGVYLGGNGIVIGCSFVGCSADNGGAIYKGVSGSLINYNRFLNNTGPGNGIVINGGSVNVDYNWFGKNTPDPIPGGVMNNYYQVQLSVNNNSTMTNTSMNFSSPVSLNYRLVLNGTNDTGDVKCLPDFNALIKLTGCDDTIINSTDEWNQTFNGGGLIDFVACVDNEILNISLLLPHPSYDLRLHNEGSRAVGSWIDSVAEPVNGYPLDSDYAVFRVTKPNGESWSSPHTPFNNKVFSYRWQLTMKGKYLVEVWAYYTHGNHVKAPQSIKRYSSKNLVTVQSVAKDEFYVS